MIFALTLTFSSVAFSKGAKKKRTPSSTDSIVSVTCNNDSCIQRFEKAYEEAGCALTLQDVELNNIERSFNDENIVVSKYYKLVGCEEPERRAGMSTYGESPTDYSCHKGELKSLSKLKRYVCVHPDDSEKRKEIEKEAAQLKKRVQELSVQEDDSLKRDRLNKEIEHLKTRIKELSVQ